MYCSVFVVPDEEVRKGGRKKNQCIFVAKRKIILPTWQYMLYCICFRQSMSIKVLREVHTYSCLSKTLQSIINVTKEMDELINKLRSTLFGLTQVFCEANVATVPGLAFVAVFLD